MQDSSESGASDPQCPFCDIIAGRDTANVIRHWVDCIAISPLNPATFGHTLLIPVAHISTIWELSESLAQSLTRRTLEVAAALKQTLELTGLNIIQSNGHDATQTVPHLHIHLVPRYTDDSMGEIWPEGSVVTEDRTEYAVRALSRALAGQESPRQELP